MSLMDEHATALAEAIEAALPGWVERSVRQRLDGAGMVVDAEILTAVTQAGREAAADVGRAVQILLEADIDQQATTPLSLLRGATRYATGVLRHAGVPPVVRDEVQERLLPDDVYDLAPATFADVDPALAEPGLMWGAAKAHLHLQRHSKRAG